LNTSSYIIAVALIFIITFDGDISLTESLGFFVFYSAYVIAVVVLGRFLRSRGLVSVVKSTISEARSVATSVAVGAGPLTEEQQQHILAAKPVVGAAEGKEPSFEEDGDPLAGLSIEELDGPLGWMQAAMELPFSALRHVSIPAAHWNAKRRSLSVVCPLFAMFVVIVGFGGKWSSVTDKWGPLPAFWWALIIGATGAALVLGCSTASAMPRWHPLILVVSLLSTIAWFNIFANECVAILETFGLVFNISGSTLGITVLAWGNCVGDLVADTALARQGKSKMAVAGVFGSLLFSDCLGLGVALTAFTASEGHSLPVSLSLNNKVAAVCLLVSVCTTTAVFTITRFSCPRFFSTVLFVEYAVFMVFTLYLEAS